MTTVESSFFTLQTSSVPDEVDRPATSYLSDCLVLLGQVMSDMDVVINSMTPVPPIQQPASLDSPLESLLDLKPITQLIGLDYEKDRSLCTRQNR